MIDVNAEIPDWSSFQRLVQDLITGAVRRHTFTQWELEFLLDLQNSRLRKSSRDGALRKYLRVVHLHHTEGTPEPPRLSAFLASEFPPRATVHAG